MDGYTQCINKIPTDPNNPLRCNFALLKIKNLQYYTGRCGDTVKKKIGVRDPTQGECVVLNFISKFKI